MPIQHHAALLNDLQAGVLKNAVLKLWIKELHQEQKLEAIILVLNFKGLI